MKKTLSLLIMLAVLCALLPSASALDLPDELAAPTSLEVSSLAVDSFQYRTLLTFTVDYDVLNVLGTQADEYGVMNLEGVMHVQFRVDDGDWNDCIFPDGTYTQKLSVSRPQSVSVLSMNNELQRGQLSEEFYYYDATSPLSSHLDVFGHSFSFRVSIELKWIYLDDFSAGSVISKWSSPASLSSSLSAETLPETLKTPVITAAQPSETENGIGVSAVEKTPLQIKLLNRYIADNGGSLGLAAQISVSNSEWQDISEAGEYHTLSESLEYLLPTDSGFDSVSAVERSNIRIRFRFYASVAEKQLYSEWSEPVVIGTYQPAADNPDFEGASFLRGSFLGISYPVIAAIVLAVAAAIVTIMYLTRKRKRVK